MIRHLPALLVALGALAGCTTPQPTGQAGIDRAVAAGAPQAYYEAFPANLFAAHAQVCQRPGETVVRPSRTEIRCEVLLPPGMTGGLILEFDGTVEDLPRLVMAFIAQSATEGGWIVTSDSYLRVPQQAGGVRELRMPDPELQEVMRELLAASGGRPL